MTLPLLSAYFLFAWVASYHNDQKVEEYTNVYTEVQSLKDVLVNPTLYDPLTSKEEIEKLKSEDLAISLYNEDGMVVYSSNPNFVHVMNQKDLYIDLYELQQGLRSLDRKSTRLNSSHVSISYAVFCLK